MYDFFNIIKEYDIYIIFWLFINVFLLLLIVITNSIRISKLTKKYNKFMRGNKDRNIEEVLNTIIDNIDECNKQTQNLKQLYNNVDKRINNCVQKVSMIRYKAFNDMGSAALSFSICLLDDYDSGVILTGIYGHNECTVYAKSIEKGIPKFDLSEEEKKALDDALKKKILKSL